MSGTIAYEQREKDKQVARLEKLSALNDNRTELLTAVAAYMHTTHGDDSFYNDHPLVSAIQQSANGNVIDLVQLTTDITNYQPPEAE